MSSYAYAGVITHRWAPQILLALKDGPCRFNTLLNGIEGISDRVLSERFRDLEERGLISREVLAGPPVRVYYGLTVSGRRYIERGEQLTVPGAEPLTRHGWNTDNWETPWEVVHTLEEEFGPFYLDPCATAENRKAPNWWDERDDGLRQTWTGPAFCNPPYSSIDAWIRKAVAEQARGQLVVMLLPVRTDRDWWHDLVQPNAEVRFLRGRQRFIGPDGTTTGRPVFASAIAVFRPSEHHA